MNEEKLNEIGALTDVESADITKNKIRRKITLFYYYLVQLGFLAISGVAGLLFGLIKSPSSNYPYSGFDYNYIFGPIFVTLTHGVNVGLSYRLRNTNRLILKKGTSVKLSPFYIYPAIFINFVLSILSFLAIYNLVFSGNVFTATTRYGVYNQKDLKILGKYI
ncbi:MAG: hypothetical protein KGD64_12930 [Candidatus Heimdallarchaeota archaeon]|nr:hypothetical protein [Candidatus Heimdallarchaeota archaeon]